MAIFKWTCCRRNVENQVDSKSRAPKNIYHHDGDFESDMQAVQWMRDRSKQQKSNDLKQQNDEEKENSPSSIKRNSSYSPNTRIPIDMDGVMDAEFTTAESSLDGLTPDSRVPITSPSFESRQQSRVSSASVDNESVDSMDEETDDSDMSALFEVDAPPSPSRTLQHYSPPRPTIYRGVKVSIIKPLQSSNSGEALEVTMRNSSDAADDEMMEIDHVPLLVIEDEPPSPPVLQESAPPRDSSHSSFPHYDDEHDDEEDARKLPFYILGQSSETCPHVLSPLVLEALRGFLPFGVSENNFHLKYSLIRDGASLSTLLHSIRVSKYTIIGVETMDGQVFGSFTGSPWRIRRDWYGTGEAFLWRVKQSPNATVNGRQQMEVYPYTGFDDQVQCCTDTYLAVGGGDWNDQGGCPYKGEPRGIGFLVDCNLERGETNSCATFANPLLCNRAETKNDFEISNVEVWTTTPCISLDEAETLEMHKLFVEEQRVATC